MVFLAGCGLLAWMHWSFSAEFVIGFKWTVSRDFLLLVFFMNQFPTAPEYPIRAVSNLFENSRRYSQIKVHHRYQRHRWHSRSRPNWPPTRPFVQWRKDDQKWNFRTSYRTKSIPGIEYEPSMKSSRPCPINVNFQSWNRLRSRVLSPPLPKVNSTMKWFL